MRRRFHTARFHVCAVIIHEAAAPWVPSTGNPVPMDGLRNPPKDIRVSCQSLPGGHAPLYDSAVPLVPVSVNSQSRNTRNRRLCTAAIPFAATSARIAMRRRLWYE